MAIGLHSLGHCESETTSVTRSRQANSLLCNNHTETSTDSRFTLFDRQWFNSCQLILKTDGIAAFGGPIAYRLDAVLVA
jgi:hypothetical protein